MNVVRKMYGKKVEVALKTIAIFILLRFLLFLLSKFSVFEASPPPWDPDVAISAHLLVVTQHHPVRGHLDTGLR